MLSRGLEHSPFVAIQRASLVTLALRRRALEACCHDNKGPYAGLEYSGQCWYGAAFNPPAGSLRAPTEYHNPCSGNKTRDCGTADRIVVFTGICTRLCRGPPPPVPPPPKPVDAATEPVGPRDTELDAV